MPFTFLRRMAPGVFRGLTLVLPVVAPHTVHAQTQAEQTANGIETFDQPVTLDAPRRMGLSLTDGTMPPRIPDASGRRKGTSAPAVSLSVATMTFLPFAVRPTGRASGPRYGRRRLPVDWPKGKERQPFRETTLHLRIA